MKNNLEKTLKQYEYVLPESFIAQKPVVPRDSARLLVYNKKNKKVSCDIFSNLARHLPKNTLLIFNRTKVLPARLEVLKPTGGKARITFVGREKGLIKFMSDRKLETGSVLSIGKKPFFVVKKQDEKFFLLKPLFPVKNLFNLLEKYGTMPLPPYIKHSPLSESQKKSEYQTVFADRKGSVAAPTASLHFTRRLIKNLKKSGIEAEFITLHVGLGTFAPLEDENIKKGKLHSEYFSISPSSAARISQAKKQGHLVVAVGTTVVRALESAFDHKGKIKKNNGTTDLFIRPGYKFKIVDSLVTNFHVPRSSLLMLVCAFSGRKEILNLYEFAKKNNYRFFSFGDAMLIR